MNYFAAQLRCDASFLYVVEATRYCYVFVYIERHNMYYYMIKQDLYIII